jgi:hypothetical protein
MSMTMPGLGLAAAFVSPCPSLVRDVEQQTVPAHTSMNDEIGNTQEENVPSFSGKALLPCTAATSAV